jgi:hypothetical protein
MLRSWALQNFTFSVGHEVARPKGYCHSLTAANFLADFVAALQLEFPGAVTVLLLAGACSIGKFVCVHCSQSVRYKSRRS